MQKYDFPETLSWHTPTIHPSAYVAPGAHLIGQVELAAQASVWYNAVLRGDINRIQIGYMSNIQDGCVCHVENDRDCTVGNHVTVGHKAILHGCTIEDGVLIGMGAIILNGAIIKKGAVIGAGAVVTENTVVPENHLVVGIPGRVLKDLGQESYLKNIKWAEKYAKLAAFHQQHQSK